MYVCMYVCTYVFSSSAPLVHKDKSELETHPRAAFSEEEVEPEIWCFVKAARTTVHWRQSRNAFAARSSCAQPPCAESTSLFAGMVAV